MTESANEIIGTIFDRAEREVADAELVAGLRALQLRGLWEPEGIMEVVTDAPDGGPG